MAKRSQKQWKQTGQYYPNARPKTKGKFIPQDRQRKKRKNKANSSNYIGYNKPKQVINTYKQFENNLETWGKTVKDQRGREGRPKIYDELADPSNWSGNTTYRRIAPIEYIKLGRYYMSDEYKEKAAKIKEVHKEYTLPHENPSFIKIGLEMAQDIRYKEAGLKIPEDSLRKAEIDRNMRRFFGGKVSKEEFENMYNSTLEEDLVIKGLYDNSKVDTKNVTYEEFRSTAYRLMREMIQKNKMYLESDEIRTQIFNNGIDDYIDEDGVLQEDINTKFAQKVIDNRVELRSKNSLLFGNQARAKKFKDNIENDNRDPLDNLTKNKYNDKTEYIYHLSDNNIMDKLFKNYPQINDGYKRATIAELFKTVGELKEAQEIFDLVNKRAKAKLSYTVDDFKELKETMDNSKKNDKVIMDKYELSKRMYNYKNMKVENLDELIKLAKEDQL